MGDGVTNTPSDSIPIITAQITITLGLSAEGDRAIHTDFVDVAAGLDDEGKEQIIQYFDGRLMLALAEDNFKICHGLLMSNDDDE